MPIGPTKTKKQKQAVVHTEMKKFKEHDLHSGSKEGPKVKSRKQAIAIAMSESHQSNPHVQQHEEAKRTRNPGCYDTSAHGDADHCREGEPFRPGSAGANRAVTKAHEHIDEGKGMQPAKSRWDDPYPYVRPHTSRPHGFGHGIERRDGALRLSGTPGAHRIGAKR